MYDNKNQLKEYEPCVQYKVGDVIKTLDGYIEITEVYPQEN